MYSICAQAIFRRVFACRGQRLPAQGQYPKAHRQLSQRAFACRGQRLPAHCQLPETHRQLSDAHLHAVNNVCRRTANFSNKQATFRRAFACREQHLPAHGQLFKSTGNFSTRISMPWTAFAGARPTLQGAQATTHSHSQEFSGITMSRHDDSW